MRSNEKSCVCNVFATSYSKNPVKSSLSSYPNANFGSARDNRPDKPIQKCSKSPEPCGFPGFFLSQKSARLCPILEGFDQTESGLSCSSELPLLRFKWMNSHICGAAFLLHLPLCCGAGIV